MKIECTVEEFKKLMKKEPHGKEALKVRINNAESKKIFKQSQDDRNAEISFPWEQLFQEF